MSEVVVSIPATGKCLCGEMFSWELNPGPLEIGVKYLPYCARHESWKVVINSLCRRRLSYLIQSGIIKFLEHRSLPSTRICPLDLQSKDRQLRNTDLMMTYFIMVTGLAAAIAVFIGEVSSDLLVRKKEEKKIGCL